MRRRRVSREHIHEKKSGEPAAGGNAGSGASVCNQSPQARRPSAWPLAISNPSLAMSTPQAMTRRSPCFSTASVIAPLIGAAAGCWIWMGRPTGEGGWFNLWEAVFVIGASLLCGLAFSVLSIVRHENFRPLSWVGFGLNSVPLLFAVVFGFWLFR